MLDLGLRLLLLLRERHERSEARKSEVREMFRMILAWRRKRVCQFNLVDSVLSELDIYASVR